MNTSAKIEVQLIIDACKKVGVTQVVISPGSRNAPFSIAFDEDPHFQVFVIPDERSAAFYALGMALATDKPVVISCTSGSAPLNYLPAISEAFYQQVPLIVLSADRPTEWVDQGDGQTIRQENMYGKHVLKSAQFPEIHTQTQRWHAERILAEVFQTAIGPVNGPVHLNVPFSEPLYLQTTEPSHIENWIQLGTPKLSVSASDEQFLTGTWKKSKKRLIIVGQQKKNPRLDKLLNELAGNPSVAVLVEHISNTQNAKFIQCIDRTLNQISTEELESFYPDLIVSIGGAIVSKRIKKFLRDSKAPVFKFDAFMPYMDTYQHLCYTSEVESVIGLEVMLEAAANEIAPSTFGSKWKQKEYVGADRHSVFMQKSTYSDLKVIDTILDVIPDNAHIHISNSSIIRYVLLTDPVRSMNYLCNRGTSGIDGSTSTASGYAMANPNVLNVLITGDLSFFYDSNALWNVDLPSNFRIIIINNAGGDIFNIIPGPSSTNQLERIFLSKHTFKAEGICATFDVEYTQVKNEEELNNSWESFFSFSENNRPKVMEVLTGEINNSAVLASYFEDTK